MHAFLNRRTTLRGHSSPANSNISYDEKDLANREVWRAQDASDDKQGLMSVSVPQYQMLLTHTVIMMSTDANELSSCQ